MKKNKLYENTYKAKNRFSFGKNWTDFLKTINNKRIKQAKNSLILFLDKDQIKNKTFIDAGSGSGLFSLAAYLIGAKKVVSLDIDDWAINCAAYLKNQQGNPKNWAICKASVLNKKQIKNLGKFDIVYSWGVLHHSGKMWQAVENVMSAVKNNGLLYLAVYNKFYGYFGGILSSKSWEKIKYRYNHSGLIMKTIMLYSYYFFFFFITLFFRFQNPIRIIKNYSLRGMSWHHDVIDWLGGYPYEYAAIEEIINFADKHGFLLKKIKIGKELACNEFLFIKKN